MDGGLSPNVLGFTEEELQMLLKNLDKLTPAELAEVTKMVEELEGRKERQRKQDDLIAFCQHMQKDYKVGAHHKRLATCSKILSVGTGIVSACRCPHATASPSLSLYITLHGIWAGTPAIRSCWCPTPPIWRSISVVRCVT
jgi:hypothetical protein